MALSVTGHDAVKSKKTKRRSWKVLAGVFWLAISLALVVWWMIFGLHHLDLGTSSQEAVSRRYFMIMGEGLTLFFLLLGGGAALLYYISAEMRRSRLTREFFAGLTHDLKTSLASLRLQVESLESDLNESKHSRLIRRLVKDTVRLELQLENSLLLASPSDGQQILVESISIGEVLNAIPYQWPDLKFEIDGNANVMVDRRALESVFKNLIQNAVVHGRANRVTVKVRKQKSEATILVTICDDGKGFAGERARLGEIFYRHTSSSGSGLGLHLAMRLIKQMRGQLRVMEVANGFCVELELPGFNDVEVKKELAK